MDAKKEFGRTVLSLDNCIIPRDLLENTPSFKDGVSRALETDLRVVGCEYIQSSGLLLKLPQVSIKVLAHPPQAPLLSPSLPPPPPPPSLPMLYFTPTLLPLARRLLWRQHRCCFNDFITQSHL